MSYELNVALNGTHYFATADRSIKTIDQVIAISEDFKKRFPKSEGFEISLSYHPEIGYGLSLKDELPIKELRKQIERLGKKH